MTGPIPKDLGVMPRVAGVLKAIGPVAGLRVVDIGCGEGQVAASLAEQGATVAGYDPFVSQTQWIKQGDGEYRLATAPADAIPEPDASVDLVLFVFSLHHVPEAQMAGAIAEARRLLRPSGQLCVAEPLAEGPNQYVMELYHDETFVRNVASAKLAQYAAPAFSSEHVFCFSEGRTYPDFEAFAAHAVAGTRFNSYTVEQVFAPEVRGRFAEMFAVHGESFELPIRLNVFSGPLPP